MKLTFRSTFLGILLTFIAVTLSLVGATSYISARFTARDLTAQLLEQTSARVELQVQKLIARATDQSALNRRLLEANRLDLADFRGIIAYWLEAMAVSPELSSLFIGSEATGESTGVSRLQGKLSIWQSNRNATTQVLEQRDFWPAEYPTTPYAFDPQKPAPDIRTRPWYSAARAAKHPIWTETYSFLGVSGAAETQGVTYATPLVLANGSLAGVLSADFDLKALSSFLETLRIGRTGFAFVIEQRDDGSERVIARPTTHADAAGDLVTALLAATRTANGGAAEFEHRGVRYIGSVRGLPGEGAPPWRIGIIVPDDDVMARVHRSNAISVAIALVGFLLAIVLGVYVARQVARPLEQLSNEMASIAALQLEPRPVAHSMVLEVDRVAVATEEMKTGLRSFQKYVPADLVRALLSSKREAQLGGERRRVTMYFSDIADFTKISEHITPEAMVEQLREYFTAIDMQISTHGGTVDKFIGDAIMAFWGAPLDNPQQALDACKTALGIRDALALLHERWTIEGKPPLATRIGINTGEVLVGNIGSAQRLNYTVVGDAVNLASRLEGLNKLYGTTILLGETTFAEVSDDVIARPLDWVAVKGRSRALTVYELLGLRGAGDEALTTFAARYSEALEHYRAQEWDAATAAFRAVLALRPNDRPSEVMLERCATYRAQPPGPQWDGVYRAQHK